MGAFLGIGEGLGVGGLLGLEEGLLVAVDDGLLLSHEI